MNISLPYNLSFINTVSSFMEEIGACYGADVVEKQRLRLIGEETFSFIMVGIPNRDFSEMFQLRCVEGDDRLTFFFSNHGRPLNVREIKEFSFDDADGTADGLSLRLLQGLCSELAFRNMGHDGWELVLSFKLKNYKHLLNDITNETTNAPLSEYTIRKCELTDIPGIINLIYNTYRYSYVKMFAYTTEHFQQQFESGKIRSHIVVTTEGKIIGHQALILYSESLAEIGMVMLDPQYRRSRAFIQLNRTVLDDIKLNFSNLIIYAQTVTSHRASQAFMTGFCASVLEVSLLKKHDFIGMDANSNPRESLLYGFMSYSPQKFSSRIFVPTEHYEMIGSILENSCFTVNIEKNTDNFADRNSTIEAIRDGETNTGTIDFLQIGNDFGSQLRKQTRLLQNEKIETIYASIPTNENQPEILDSLLRDNDYFFIGIKPDPQKNMRIIYCNLLNQKFNFEALQLFSPKAIELGNYIKTLHNHIIEL